MSAVAVPVAGRTSGMAFPPRVQLLFATLIHAERGDIQVQVVARRINPGRGWLDNR